MDFLIEQLPPKAVRKQDQAPANESTLNSSGTTATSFKSLLFHDGALPRCSRLEHGPPGCRVVKVDRFESGLVAPPLMLAAARSLGIPGNVKLTAVVAPVFTQSGAVILFL